MTISKCRGCGSEAEKRGWSGGCVVCSNIDCRIVGPSNDPDGAKWNALMATPERDPRAVEVKVPVHYSKHTEQFIIKCNLTKMGNTANFVQEQFPLIATITAYLVPPAVQEVAGEVE